MNFTKTLPLENHVTEILSRIFRHMGVAVTISMLVSYFIGTNQELFNSLFTGWLQYAIIFAPIIAIFPMSWLLESCKSRVILSLALYIFAMIMGTSLSTIFAIYTIGSIANAFMGASVFFITMSIYGYYTEKDLSSIGNICFIGLISIILVSIINLFIGSTVTNLIISAVSILIFLGFTAYDIQNIKNLIGYNYDNPALEISGALQLYLDFINLFVNILRLIGVLNEKN